MQGMNAQGAMGLITGMLKGQSERKRRERDMAEKKPMQDLQQQMLKLQIEATKVKQTEAKTKSQLINMFLSQQQAKQSQEAGATSAPAAAPSSFSESFGETGQQQQGPGLTDQMASASIQMDPRMAMVMGEATGMDFLGAGRMSETMRHNRATEATASRPKNEIDLQLKAIQGDTSAQQALDRITKRKMELANAGRSSVEVKNMGSIPPGYKVEYDENNNPVAMTPIAGGPVSREIESQEKKEKAARRQTQVAGATVVQDLQRGLDIVKSNRLASGAPALLMGKIPESDTQALQGMIDSALSNIGFDQLNSMRQNSPTGGALGNVTELQLKQLQQVLGNLEVQQRKEVLEDNLKRAINIYMDITHGTSEQIQSQIKSGAISAQEAAPYTSRYQLSFDEFGRKVGQRGKPSLKMGGGNTAPAPAAPAGAVEFLRKNPNLSNDFKEKYGYLPEGF